MFIGAGVIINSTEGGEKVIGDPERDERQGTQHEGCHRSRWRMESCCSTGESLGGCVNNTDKAAEVFVGYVFFPQGCLAKFFCFGTDWTGL